MVEALEVGGLELVDTVVGELMIKLKRLVEIVGVLIGALVLGRFEESVGETVGA